MDVNKLKTKKIPSERPFTAEYLELLRKFEIKE